MNPVNTVRRVVVRMIEALAPGYVKHHRDVPQLQANIAALSARCDALEQSLARLDFDLDESRRLNLRAAEVLDIALEHISGAGMPR